MAAVKRRLGEMLIEAGVIDEDQLNAALGHQRKWGGRLGQALVDLKLATEVRVVEALSIKFGCEVVKPGSLEPGPALEAALPLVPREFAIRNGLIPYAADIGSVSVAMSDPANIAVVDELSFRVGRRVKIALAGDREIADALRRYYGSEGGLVREGISLDAGDEQPSEAIVEHFEGGSTEALEQFFTSSASSSPVAPLAPAGKPPSRALTEKERALLDALEQLAKGGKVDPSLVVKPTQMLAALVLLLVKKGFISEIDFLGALRGN